MLLHELLIKKGFKLNTYPQGKYYEIEIKDENKMANILSNDYMGDEEYIVFQLKEDFSNKVMMVDTNVWDLTDNEFEEYLKRI